MSTATIRPYAAKDRDRVRQICMDTAGPGFRETERRRQAAAAAFCEYFIDHSPEFCFVAADEADEAVGYILCAASFGRWCRYAPEAFGVSFPRGLLWSVGSMLGAVPYLKKYPAHLHINLLAPYRRLGLGRQLMQALEQRLRDAGISGVSLCVGAENTGGMRFYESCGFQVLGRHPGAVAYGKQLSTKER